LRRRGVSAPMLNEDSDLILIVLCKFVLAVEEEHRRTTRLRFRW